MTFKPRPPYPVHLWEEPPLQASDLVLPLTTYLLLDGSVRFLGVGDAVPAGAVPASAVDAGGGSLRFVTPVVVPALAVVQNGSGMIFFLS